MQRFFYRNLVSMLLAVLALAVAALLPFGGGASAATSICPPGEGGPNCDLAISAPESVASGHQFTVQVALGVETEGGFMTLPKNDPCASKVVVTLKVFITEGPPFATYNANAKNGVATFNVGGLPPGEGPYSADLHASAVQTSGSCTYNDESVPVQVVPVSAGQPIAPCPNDVACEQLTSGGGTAATLFTDTPDGSFDARFEMLTAAPNGPLCAGRGPADSNGVLEFHFSAGTTTPSSKKVVFGLTSNLVAPGIHDDDEEDDDDGHAHLRVCWNDGSGWHFLAKCKKTGPPCVAHKKMTDDRGALIEVHALPGDPWAYVE